jgi:hypothetical protein
MFSTRRGGRVTAALLLTFIGAGLSLSVTGCGDKSAATTAVNNDRKSFRSDPSKMPPEVKAQIEAAQRNGANAAARAQSRAAGR